MSAVVERRAPYQTGPTWDVIDRADVTGDMRAYKPYGASEAAMYCRDPVILVDGPAGTGKSLGALHKLLTCMIKWPNSRGAIGRKYRKTLTDSALVTWEEDVLGRDHPAVVNARREQRHIYYLPNGSTVTVTGLDEAEKQKSAQYDFFYLQEATEIERDDLAQVIRGMRNNVMPFQQIYLDCNPDAPLHWIKRAYEAGEITRFASTHKDNPALWDHEAEAWTEFGTRYIAGLDTLTGVLLQRLRYGIWAAAEGAVYDCFDVARDVVEPFAIPDAWPRRVGLDFGAVNTVALFFAREPETGLYYLYREYHAGGRTAGDHIAYLRHGEPRDLFIVGGAGNEGQWRHEFQRAGLTVMQPPKIDVALGITRVYGQHRRGTIKVFNTCEKYLEQKLDYRYKRDYIGSTAAIENKEAYHYMDAERYIIGYDFPESTVERLQEMMDQLPVVSVW